MCITSFEFKIIAYSLNSKNLTLNLNYNTDVSVDKLIHNQVKTFISIDLIIYFIGLYVTRSPANRIIYIFKFKNHAII